MPVQSKIFPLNISFSVARRQDNKKGLFFIKYSFRSPYDKTKSGQAKLVWSPKRILIKEVKGEEYLYLTVKFFQARSLNFSFDFDYEAPRQRFARQALVKTQYFESFEDLKSKDLMVKNNDFSFVKNLSSSKDSYHQLKSKVGFLIEHREASEAFIQYIAQVKENRIRNQQLKLNRSEKAFRCYIEQNKEIARNYSGEFSKRAIPKEDGVERTQKKKKEIDQEKRARTYESAYRIEIRREAREKEERRVQAKN